MLFCASHTAAQSATDSAAIRQTALDYIEGWYTGDAVRTERALHPELAKRIVRSEPASGRSRLDHMGAGQLVQYTRERRGATTPPEQRRTEVRILDIFEQAASVRVDAHGWIDYMHLGKVDGHWKIINVLWELRPAQEERPRP